MNAGPAREEGTESAIDVAYLTFSFRPDTEPVLVDVSFSLPKGSRTILIGSNGAGKTTLLQILAGKRLTPQGARVYVLGRDAFRKPPQNVTFLGTEWAANPVVRSDIPVQLLLDSVGGYRHKERRDRLLDILDVDLDWHMHEISDGERRRVQLVMGLMIPWDVLLLDEVTTDLDVLVRGELIDFLRQESESRGATVLYATHIFDGINDFPTHVMHMRFGQVVGAPIAWSPTCEIVKETPASCSTRLHALAYHWLMQDREYHRRLEDKVHKKRGARRNNPVPSDSETFFRKYDYSH